MAPDENDGTGRTPPGGSDMPLARNEITESLLRILQEYAPDSHAQEICAQMLRAAQAEGESVRTQHLTLAGALCDGLRYGNWPWITRRPLDVEQITSPE